MSGELIAVWGTPVVLEASGAVMSNNSTAQADDAYYDVVDNGGGYPNADFALTVTMASAPAENALLYLYAQPLDVDGTTDTQASELNRPTLHLGVFALNDVGTAQTLYLSARDLPKRANYFIGNASGVAVSSGWRLVVTPRTYKPAA